MIPIAAAGVERFSSKVKQNVASGRLAVSSRKSFSYFRAFQSRSIFRTLIIRRLLLGIL